MATEDVARGNAGPQSPGVDNCKPKPAWRHGVPSRLPVLVECNLHAGYLRHLTYLVDESPQRMPVSRIVRTKQDDAVSVAAILIRELPFPFMVEPDHRLDPPPAVEIGPLVAHPQVHFDHPAAD